MIREDDTRFKHLERKIGMFVLAAAMGIALILILVGVQRGFFTKTYNLHFTVDRGTGFSKGMPVKLSGFRIGRITGLALNEQAMVEVFIEVDRKYSKWIRTDSTVKLVKEGLVGDSIVEVAVGSFEKPEIKDGEPLIYIKTKALDELAHEIAQKVKPVLVEVRDIIAYINDPEGDLKKSVRNIELLTRNLDKTRSEADLLLVTTGKNLDAIAQKSGLLLESTNKKIENLDIAKLNASLEKLPPLLDKTDSAMKNINAITMDTKKLAEQTFPAVPGLLYSVDELLYDTDRLINSLNNSWILGGSGAKPGKTGRTFRAGDSHE